SGEGPPIILVDGALGYREHHGGRPLAAELARMVTAVTYDRRGRGESGDTLPYAIEREIDDIAALVDTVGAPAHLYGFSSGAVLALRAAAALGDRVASLALLEPPFGGDSETEHREHVDYCDRMRALLAEGRRNDAVTFFLQDML